MPYNNSKNKKFKVLTVEDAKVAMKTLHEDWMIGGFENPNKSLRSFHSLSLNLPSLVGRANFRRDGTQLEFFSSAPCHGNLSYSLDNNIGITLSTYDGKLFSKHVHPRFGNKSPSVEEQMEFIKWLVSDDMPLSKYILVRNSEYIFNQGLIIDVNLSGVTGALFLCKALRQAYECGTRIIEWNKLVQNDIDPMLALYLSHIDNRFTTYEAFHGQVFIDKDCFNFKNLLTREVITKNLNKGECSNLFLNFIPNSVSIFLRDYYKCSRNSKGKRIANGWGGDVFILREILNRFEKIKEIQKDFYEAAKQFQQDIKEGVVK